MKKLTIAPSLRPSVLMLLKETRTFIAHHPYAWIQGDSARDENGRTCDALSPVAKHFCALGFAQNRAGELFGVRTEVHTPGTPPTIMLSLAATRIEAAAEDALDSAARIVSKGEAGGVMMMNDGDEEAKQAFKGSRAKVLKTYAKAIELVADLG